MFVTLGGPLTSSLSGQTPVACHTIGPELFSYENSIADLVPGVKLPWARLGANRAVRTSSLSRCAGHLEDALWTVRAIRLSWSQMLIRQDASPFGPCLTLGLEWRPARFKSTSGHAMSPDCLTGGYSGKWITLVNRVFIQGSPQLFVALIIRFHRFSTTAKRDRFKYSKRSLSIAYIMASGDTCPLLAILVGSQPMG